MNDVSLTIKIDSRSAAFDDMPKEELIRIAQEGLTKIYQGSQGRLNLRDLNGNTVGHIRWEVSQS